MGAYTLLRSVTRVGRLRELRRQRVLSLRELAESSGLNYNTVWRLENGLTEAHPRTIHMLADALAFLPASW